MKLFWFGPFPRCILDEDEFARIMETILNDRQNLYPTALGFAIYFDFSALAPPAKFEYPEFNTIYFQVAPIFDEIKIRQWLLHSSCAPGMLPFYIAHFPIPK